MKLLTLSIILFVFLLLTPLSSSGQIFDELGKESTAKDRIYIEPGFGLSYTQNVFNVGVAPGVGYRITNGFSMGFGYQYDYILYHLFNPSVSVHEHGINIFARHNIIDPVFVQVSYMYASKQDVYNDGTLGDRFVASSLYGGVGISQPMLYSDRLYYTITLQFNLAELQVSTGQKISDKLLFGFSVIYDL